jgi:hypothetical protein
MLLLQRVESKGRMCQEKRSFGNMRAAKTLISKKVNHEKGADESSERLVFAVGGHENQLAKRNQVFERKKAAKRNVANRPLLGWFTV